MHMEACLHYLLFIFILKLREHIANILNTKMLLKNPIAPVYEITLINVIEFFSDKIN